ncbi:GNAT family N-acetyltransferase [Streptomyces sp. NPDC057638]|uniref:GNAT family N-acetyltransferase n=1 Tax=Streptomyces sp. NPDC057638 TaxID=3346190 RepID=UPI0036A65E65
MKQHTEVQVRPGTEADLTALTALYNHYVRETSITFDITPFTPEERLPWLRSHPEDGPHRLLVARDTGYERTEAQVSRESRESSSTRENPADGWGGLLGYVTSSPLRPKAAYDTSIEVSVYCAPEAAGRGIGTLLYKSLFEALADEDLHRAYAVITQPNEASERLHARFGFRRIGTYTEAGRKFDRYWDVTWFEKKLGPDA